MDNHPEYSQWTEVGVCCGATWEDAMGGKPTWHDLPVGCIGARIRLRMDDKIVCHLRFPWGIVSMSAQYMAGGNWRPGYYLYGINHRGRIADRSTSKADAAELLYMLAEIEAE